MVNINLFQEKINKKYPNEQLLVLDYQGARSNCKIKCLSCGKIYDYSVSGNLLSKKKPAICHACQDSRIKYKNFIKRLEHKYPLDKLKVLNFKSSQEPVDIRCSECGSVYHFEKPDYAMGKTRNVFCLKCFPLKNDMMKESLKRFEDFIEKSFYWELVQPLDKIHSDDLISCKCLYCGRENKKTIYDYMRGRGCFCQSGTERKTTEQFKQELDDGYELLSEYKQANEKVLIKHNCGFVYSVTPHNYLCGKRCPRCSRKESKGEKRIKNFLDAHSIKYYQEYPVIIEQHHLRFDFYLPDYNRYIEYQGIQHYGPIEYFGGESRFLQQRELDNKKKEYAKDKLLIIGYFDYNKIDEILASALKFNDYPNCGVNRK